MPDEFPDLVQLITLSYIRLPRVIMDALEREPIVVPRLPNAVRLLQEEISPLFGRMSAAFLEDNLPRAKDALARINRLIREPTPIAHFSGLTASERSVAHGQWKAHGARAVPPENLPELTAATRGALDAFDASRPIPRLIRVQSDLPLLRLLPSRNGPASLLVSDDMRRIQSQGGLEALIRIQIEKAEWRGEKRFVFFRPSPPSTPGGKIQWTPEDTLKWRDAAIALDQREMEIQFFISQLTQHHRRMKYKSPRKILDLLGEGPASSAAIESLLKALSQKAADTMALLSAERTIHDLVRSVSPPSRRWR